MTTLNHEFDDTDNTSDSLRAEEHDYAETVNDSGFLGVDNSLEDDSLGDGAVDENGFSDYDDTEEKEVADEPPAFLPPTDSPLPAVETSADLTEEEDAPEHPVPEALGEHREGESLGEWLRNDWEQTKHDLHIGDSK